MDPFLIRLTLSFIVAGAWITLATILSEKLGTKIGGLIGNMPSNILVSLLFIGWTQTPEFAANAAKIVPLVMVIDAIFLFAIILFAKKYKYYSFIPALLIWFILAIPIGLIAYDDIIIGTIIYIIATIILFYISEKHLNIQSIEKTSKIKYSLKELVIRAVFSGGVVASAVAIAAFLGPVWGGVFSTFPAVMLTTMYILMRTQGPDFARATGKVMIPASLNIAVYAIAVYITYPLYGLILGTIISYIAAAVSIIILKPFLNKVK